MAKAVCAEHGCATLIPSGQSRCPRHARMVDAARGRRQERGYDNEHDRLRATWQQRLNAGHLVRCWRCDKQVDPNSWQLGHCDTDRSKYHGPEHVACNSATKGRAGCSHSSHL